MAFSVTLELTTYFADSSGEGQVLLGDFITEVNLGEGETEPPSAEPQSGPVRPGSLKDDRGTRARLV